MSEAPHADLSSTELELRGAVVGDSVDERIRWLAIHRLDSLATSADGWDWLFRDPSDGRLWELTFPEGSLHGSGPRRLCIVSAVDALARYGLA